MIPIDIRANISYSYNIDANSGIADNNKIITTNSTNLASGSLTNTKGEDNFFGKGLGGASDGVGYSGSGYGAGGAGGAYYYGGGGGGFDPNAYYGLAANTITGVPVSKTGAGSGLGVSGVFFLELTKP
jgi:hypothetical protein